jgi:hypothetical protein
MKEQSRELLPVGSPTAGRTTARYASLAFQVLLLLSSAFGPVVATKQEQRHKQSPQPHSLATTTSATTTSTLPVRALKKSSDSSSTATDLWCKIVVFDVLYAQTAADEAAATETTTTTTDVFYGCYPLTGNIVSELHYTVQLPNAIVAAQPAPDNLDQWWVAVPGGTIDTVNAAVVVPDATTMYTASGPPAGRRLSQQQLDRHHSRRLASATGDLTVLVVYIRTRDADPSFSTDTAYETVFSNPVSLKNQFKACSQGKLILNPTALSVLDVTVPMSVNADKNAIVTAAEKIAVAKIDDASITNTRQYADLVMYIVPPGNGDWLAYASVGGGMSVYNDEWGKYLSAMAHEIGYVHASCSIPVSCVSC